MEKLFTKQWLIVSTTQKRMAPFMLYALLFLIKQQEEKVSCRGVNRLVVAGVQFGVWEKLLSSAYLIQMLRLNAKLVCNENL